MRKVQIQDADIMRLAIQDEILKSEESRYDHRLHGILLFAALLSGARSPGILRLRSIHSVAKTQ